MDENPKWGRDRLIAASGLPEWCVRGFIRDRALQISSHETVSGGSKAGQPKNETIASHIADTGVSRATAYRILPQATQQPTGGRSGAPRRLGAYAAMASSTASRTCIGIASHVSGSACFNAKSGITSALSSPASHSS